VAVTPVLLGLMWLVQLISFIHLWLSPLANTYNKLKKEAWYEF